MPEAGPEVLSPEVPKVRYVDETPMKKSEKVGKRRRMRRRKVQ